MKLLRLLLVVAIVGAVTFSCKKSETEKAKENLKEAVDQAKEATQEAAEDVKDATEQAAEDIQEATEEAANDVKEAAEDMTDDVKDAAKDVQQAAEEMLNSAGVSVDYPKDRKLEKEVNASILMMAKKNPNIKKMFSSAYGYAVFPKITKGGLGVGGAGGKGLVFENNHVIGSASLAQITVGLQAGGQQYAEYIFFKDKAALNRFKNGKMKFEGGVSAVALDKAVSSDIDYQNGVAVYTYSNKGLMADASIGTQKFTFHAK